MKTINEVRNKVLSLKKKLSKKKICENFGQKEYRELYDFIGCIWDYSPQERTELLIIVNDFYDWCSYYPFPASLLK